MAQLDSVNNITQHNAHVGHITPHTRLAGRFAGPKRQEPDGTPAPAPAATKSITCGFGAGASIGQFLAELGFRWVIGCTGRQGRPGKASISQQRPKTDINGPT